MDSFSGQPKLSLGERIKLFFGKIFPRSKTNGAGLNRPKISKPVSDNPFVRNWKMILVITVVVLLFLFSTSVAVAAVGMYRYNWDNRFTKIAVKILPFPAAIVGFDSVSMQSYQKEVTYVKHFYEKTGQTAPDDAVLRKQILDQLVERNILEHQARRYNITVSTSEIDQEFQSIANENGGESEVEGILAELYGLSVNDFKSLIKAQLIQQKLEDEVPLQYQAKHILISWTKKKGTAKKKAAISTLRKIRKSILDGKITFEKAAKKYSQDTSTAKKGGSLGWVPRGQMVTEFENALFAMKKDEVSGLVQTKYGFHIIKTEDIKGKVDKSYSDWVDSVTQSTKIWKLVN